MLNRSSLQTPLNSQPNYKNILNFFLRHWLLLKWDYLTTFLEENRQNIFYLFVFYVVTIGLFVERFAHYSFMSEHLDLRHIMGVGIAITRGSAASLSFCYSLLLLTMSRNLLTKLKVSLTPPVLYRFAYLLMIGNDILMPAFRNSAYNNIFLSIQASSSIKLSPVLPFFSPFSTLPGTW